MPNQQQQPQNDGLGTKKSIFVMIIVVACIAVIWPKIISPMFAVSQRQLPADKYGTPGCCKFVVNHQFSNVSHDAAFTRTLKVPDSVFRQERTAHVKDTGIHPAMQERGRAIPTTNTVPIVEKKSPNSYTYHVEGRPGPIPGLRPSLAGSMHQHKRRDVGGGSPSFLMPAYTIGILVFFLYTILKLLKKNKEVPDKTQKKTEFKKKVFHAEVDHSKRVNQKIGWDEHKTNLGSVIDKLSIICNQDKKSFSSADIGLSESIELLEISLLKQKLRQTENEMCSIIADMTENEHKNTLQKDVITKTEVDGDNQQEIIPNIELSDKDQDGSDDKDALSIPLQNKYIHQLQSKKDLSYDSSDCSVKVLGLELTTSCDGNQQWSRPQTPSHDKEPALQSIFLEGTIGHESNILVKDAETKTDEILSDDFERDDPMVVLSSKMTLSLINMDGDRTN